MRSVDFRILGPVEVTGDTGSVDLGGPLEKAILARLLLDAGRVVSVDRLIEDLWEGEPPGSANVSIRVRVSKLRKGLAAAGIASTIRTQQPGYVFVLDPADTFDVSRFESLLAAGRKASQAAEHEKALSHFEEALSLWRGPALSGIGEAPFARSEIARLDEARLAAIEDRIEAGLAAGHHAEHAVELETLVAQHPLRERLWAQRMTALYRSGRQADALASFQELRKILNQELGLDPSPELARLEAQILAQSPEISLRAPRAPDSALPTGVVTFLLTDIEGSTQLWEAHPVAMAAALERHDRLASHLIAERGGHLIKSKGEGDATLSVFRRATDAVAAALELGRAFDAEPWPDGMTLRVRMAIHTGEAHERDGDYFGPAVNRAARVRSLASGGQFLLSQVAAELVRDALPGGGALVDLGERSLRGLARAEHVFELVPAGAESIALPPEHVAPSRPPVPDAVVVPPGSQFVGREMELERLGTLLKDVAPGGLRAVFAAGEPGIGKTRLCSEFAHTAHDEGAVVLYGRCDEEPLVPYQPFVEALRRWSSALSPRERNAIPGADYLAPLVAELSGAARPPVEDPEVARYKFFEAVASALEHAAIAGPVVLVLDDLHWADRPTLQLLQHIVRTRSASPILILGTYRETDLSRTRPLAEALADFRRERRFERIALHGLAEEEIVALLERAATHDVGGTGRVLARALSQTTEGNPFFIEQILGNLVDTGRLALRDGRWFLEARVEDLGIPEGVVEAIGRRLSRLSDLCNKTLAAASVLGRDFEVDTLTRVVESDPDDVLASIEEALQVGLVRELPARGRAACTFSHALVQQALYGELSLARKQRLHLKAAAAIETTHANDIQPYVTSLARHLREAGAAADPGKAIDYSARAMDAAARVFAFEEGIAHGEAALELIEEYSVGGPQSARLHERLGDMHYIAGLEYERSFGHYEAALAAYGLLDESHKVARVHIKYGRGLATFIDVSDINKALDHLHAAERILGPSPIPQIAGPLALGLAASSTYHLDVETGLEAANRAMDIARELGSESIWATAAAFKSWALGILGRFDETDELSEQSWTVADRLDNVLTAFAAAWIRCNEYARDPNEHSRLAIVELDKPRQAQTIMPRRAMQTAVAGALAFGGKMREARAVLDGVSDWRGIGFGRRLFAESFEKHQGLIAEDIERYRSIGHHWIEEQNMALDLGVVQWATGATESARETFDAALALMAGRSPTDECETNARLAILEAWEENSTKAAGHLLRCEEILARGNGWRGYLGNVALARAVVAAGDGRFDDVLFSEAIDIYRRYGLPFGEAEALHMWGRALVASDAKRALEKYDAALEIYTSREIGKAWIERVLAERGRLT
jgi:DNA-binding SARP family transcriptional activator